MLSDCIKYANNLNNKVKKAKKVFRIPKFKKVQEQPPARKCKIAVLKVSFSWKKTTYFFPSDSWIYASVWGENLDS